MGGRIIFIELINRIDAGSMDVVSLITGADALTKGGEPVLAQLVYKYWLLANPDHPLRHIIMFNVGSQALQSGDGVGAIRHLAAAVEVVPDFYPAYLNLSSAWERSGDQDKALDVLKVLLNRLTPVSQQNIGHKVQALKSIARIKRSAELSEAALRESIEVDPTPRDVVQHWVNRRQGRCVWPALTPVGALSVRSVLERMAPLSMGAYSDDPLLQLVTAKAYTEQMRGAPGGIEVIAPWPAPQIRPKKLRIGYLSSDFCHHAVGYLMSDVFENHDRARFEISVFNIGERNNDAIQTRIMSQVDHWEDIRGVPDKVAASKVLARGIDILVDMNGHTNYQRTGLLALRPAPVIANWLGYPGTMGSNDHHYIIADDFLIPERYEPFYSERVLRLPCYQPNGKLYPVPPVMESRQELGLPETGVVFCCFNGSVKITESVFSRWMQILHHVPGSVIWLRGSPDDEFAAQLRLEAVKRGVAPERLVFLSFRSNTEYLGCHRYADLFLDTFPYGAHTTASDALRMGVPIVTLAGMSFASRVCGSLSRAAGLPDLVCATPEEYVAKAIVLGNDPMQLTAVKAKLAAALPGCDLFNAPKLVGSLEGLFEAMWQDYAEGKQRQPDVGWVSFDLALPPDATAVSSQFRAEGEYWKRLALLGDRLPARLGVRELG